VSGRATIFALASGAGRAGVAVVRLSGPDAGRALQVLTGLALPVPRRAVLRDLRARSGEVIDKSLILWFPAPASFTGEDVVELHVHGGRAVLNFVFAELSALPWLRPADPGEYSRRAFENNRLDLTAAEGLADLVAAETEMQRRQALRQMEGRLGDLYESWRSDLVGAMAQLEALVDFPDEDLPDGLISGVGQRVQALEAAISAHLDDNRAGERLRDGLSVVILGAPNVGKSSFLNTLAGRDAAIVSATPGTTRDIVEVHLDLGGLPVALADTAGLRETADDIEAEGIRRALRHAERADLKLIMLEAGPAPYLPADLVAELDDNALLVGTKADLVSSSALAHEGRRIWPVSVRSGSGMDALLAEVQTRLSARFASSGTVGITRIRHRQALEEALLGLRRYDSAPYPELGAEDLRLAARHIGRITGRVDVEDILDVLFGTFCIGK